MPRMATEKEKENAIWIIAGSKVRKRSIPAMLPGTGVCGTLPFPVQAQTNIKTWDQAPQLSQKHNRAQMCSLVSSNVASFIGEEEHHFVDNKQTAKVSQ